MILKLKILVAMTVAALAAVFGISLPSTAGVPQNGIAQGLQGVYQSGGYVSTGGNSQGQTSPWYNQNSPWSGQNSPWSGGWGSGSGSSANGAGSSTNSGSTTATATSAESTGLVLITTDVGWGSGEAAGSGMIIDSSGIVITNHHVVASSTSVNVTVAATNQTYTADVLGYDATTDVAVLQLEGASNLTTVTTSTVPASAGDTITAVGNAEGKGVLVSATGQVTNTGQNITVTEDDGSQAQLTNLIEMSAAIVPGDSGGAVLNSNGDVVAMNVAGSTDPRVTDSYAIPIASVMAVAQDVLSGTSTSTVSLDRTGGLGVEVATATRGTSGGAYIVGVIQDGPADQAGVTAGSTLTSVGGTAITSNADLSTVLATYKPGDKVTIAWTDLAGQSHTATVTLTQAPLR